MAAAEIPRDAPASAACGEFVGPGEPGVAVAAAERHRVLAAIDGFDRRVDERLERLRGNPVADSVFTAASTLGDFSLIWHLVGGVRGLTSEERAQQAFELSALLGAESMLVNQGVKRLFGRTRPTERGDERYQVRSPIDLQLPERARLGCVLRGDRADLDERAGDGTRVVRIGGDRGRVQAICPHPPRQRHRRRRRPRSGAGQDRGRRTE